MARKGQIIDASIVAAPRQRNSRKENAAIKQGNIPEDWSDKPAMKRQKDVDARWTKKHGKSHYGYKNHISVDNQHKLIRHFEVTDASVHDSQIFDILLDPDNSSGDVWADSAYRSEEKEQQLQEQGYRSQIQRKGSKNRPLTEREQRGNRTRSKVRSRVEHIFGAQVAMGGKLVRTIGLARARVKIVMTNIAYNIKRWAWLEARAV